jgi:hypothetical protein
MLACPSSTADAAKSEIAYGYNSLLIQPTGVGISEQQMRNPSEVGVICDADPVGTTGGLIGGGYATDNVATPLPVVTPSNRHAGVIAGFADGHAKYLPGNFKINANDYTDPIFRAFYMIVNIGLVDPVGGAVDPLAAGTAENVYIGGDSCCEPIIAAAAYAWKAKNTGANVYTRGFNGQSNTLGQGGAGTNRWAWGVGDGNAGANRVAIGHDVVLVIINQNTKVGQILSVNTKHPQTAGIAAADQVYCLGTATINSLFAAGFVDNSVQAYTYDTKSGTRTFFQNRFGVGTIGTQSVVVANDREMQDKVAADPYGIGYMSNALVDLTRVQVLGILKAQPEIYPNSNVKTRWLKPADYTGFTGYRQLYYLHNGTQPNFASVMTSANLTNGPLFKLGYDL